MREADAFREANELRAFIEVADDGSITDSGHLGTGHLGVTRMKVGPKELSVAAVALPTIQSEPEVGDGWVRFKQTAGGRTGAPAPRRVRGKPFFRINSAIAWTTLALTIKADGSSEHELAGASPFPRHWVYDKDGKLVQKSGTIDFEQWYRESHGENTPWGAEDSEAFVTEVESALERELSQTIMRSDATSKPRQLDARRDAHRAGRGRRRHLSPARRSPRGRGRRRDGRRGRPRRDPRRAGAHRGRPAGRRRCARSRPRRSWSRAPTRSSRRRSRSWPEHTGARRRRLGTSRERIASSTWSTRPSRSESASRLSPPRPARADRISYSRLSLSPRSRASRTRRSDDRERMPFVVELPERVVVLAGARRAGRRSPRRRGASPRA